MFRPLSSIHQLKRSFATTATKNTRSRRYLAVGACAVGIYASWELWHWHYANDKRLNPDRYVQLELVEKEQLTHDAYRLRLATEAQPHASFPTLSCLYIKDDNIQVMRPYTPINDPYKDGHVDLIVKRYQHGSISKMLSRTELHEKIFVRGPMEEYAYQPNSSDEIGMVTIFIWQQKKTSLNVSRNRLQVELV